MKIRQYICAVLLCGACFLLVLGRVFALPQSSFPQRIVSLVPAITEQLYLLGAQDRIVGVTSYCQRPPEARLKERVGAVVEVNVEKIVSLHPDLVITSPLTDHKQIQKLRDMGVKVQIFLAPRDFKDLCKGFLELSHVVGREVEARAIVKQATGEIDAIKRRMQGLSRPRVFIQIGARPLVAAGGNYFIDDLISFANGVNIAHGVKTGVYSREEVVRKDPDIILIAKMGMAGEQEKAVWMKYKTIKAVQERKIYMVDPYRFCSPTPLSFVESVKDLVRLFHGTE